MIRRLSMRRWDAARIPFQDESAYSPNSWECCSQLCLSLGIAFGREFLPKVIFLPRDNSHPVIGQSWVRRPRWPLGLKAGQLCRLMQAPELPLGSAEVYGGGWSILLPSLSHRAFSNKAPACESPPQALSVPGTWRETELNFGTGHQENGNSNYHVAKIKILTIQSVGEDEKLWRCKLMQVLC